MGAYIRTNGFVVPERLAAFIPGPYRVPNYLAEIDCVMTNKTPTGSYRGPGRFEANFVRERAIDLLAQKLQIDPADIRRKNLIKPHEMPYNSAPRPSATMSSMTAAITPISSKRRCRRPTIPRCVPNSERRARKAAISASAFAPLSRNRGSGPETGRVRIDGSGHVEVHTGVTSMGQGLETVLAQICAEQLDISPDLITVRHGDTSLIPLGAGAYGSRGTVTGGSALWRAAGELRKKLLGLAAHRLEVDIEELRLVDGAAVVPGTDISMSFRELARAAIPGQPMPGADA